MQSHGLSDCIMHIHALLYVVIIIVTFGGMIESSYLDEIVEENCPDARLVCLSYLLGAGQQPHCDLLCHSMRVYVYV